MFRTFPASWNPCLRTCAACLALNIKPRQRFLVFRSCTSPWVWILPPVVGELPKGSLLLEIWPKVFLPSAEWRSAFSRWEGWPLVWFQWAAAPLGYSRWGASVLASYIPTPGSLWRRSQWADWPRAITVSAAQPLERTQLEETCAMQLLANFLIPT